MTLLVDLTKECGTGGVGVKKKIQPNFQRAV